MNKLKKAAMALGGVAVSAGPALAVDPTLTMPTVDYTNIFAVAALGLGIAVTVKLIRRAKGLV